MNSPLLHRHHLMNTAHRPAQIFIRGEGAWLYDAEGRRYLDWMQGWAVNALGHAPAPVAAALAAQAGTLLTASPALHNAPALELAARLCQLSDFDQVFFASSGAEANEGAIKLARKWGRLHRAGAHQIITFGRAFHGRTLAAMAASGKPGWDALFPPGMPGFARAEFNNLESVERLIGPRTVAVMLEPVQGEAGVIPADAEFMRGLRQLCDQRGLLLIVDEVQTGCGRTGPLFAYQHYGIRPDIMTLGKGLGGGVPISALLATDRVSCFEPGDQGGTYCGNPLVCAAALAVLETLTAPAFLETAWRHGELLADGLRSLSREFALGEVRGSGMLWALELGRNTAPLIAAAAMDAGLLLNAPHPHCLRFMPPLNSSAAEIETGLSLLAEALAHYA
ncbi:acetylornithine transaminase [Chitinilyticum piscinae]|uniref:Acetylornithine aminotransferase n=1 Tax=Chitinilyticum piscinae TaxID=2866724 RepID=A0A8J7K9H0_9NEIS|nr:acetylornithine transaminase [Chitinilyticum piscinae]MBE9608104.1 acetylornithine transaminase [Chitinilyticum piscinae]